MDSPNYASERRVPERRILFSGIIATFVASIVVLAACDGENLFSGGGRGDGEDLTGPVVEILSPQDEEPFPLSDSVMVRVRVADPSGVADIQMKGVAIRRDDLSNTVIVSRYAERSVPFPQAPATTLPLDTVIQRLLPPLPDTTSEPVYLIVTARDSKGNTSADTINIIDGPRITIVDPEPGSSARVNSTLLVRLVASDRVSGLDSMKLIISGVVSRVETLRNLGNRLTVDTVLTLQTGPTAGNLTLQPGVWNRRGVGGLAAPVTIPVTTVASANDTTKPRVLRTLQTSERLELGDSIRLTVRATDGAGSGVMRMGAVVQVVPDTDQLAARTIFLTTATFSPALSGTAERVFGFVLGDIYSDTETTLPRKFTIHAHAFAVDAVGNCGASAQVTLTSAECESITSGAVEYFTSRGPAPVAQQVTAVAGQSVTLPGGGKIADAVVDPIRQRVYLSNIQNNRVEIFHIGADTFDVTGARAGACAAAGSGLASCRGVVGAAPWGLAINKLGDSLIVANSGGTNISVLPLVGTDYMREHVSRRVLTPNVVLWQVTQAETPTGLRYTATYFDYSDRPQFVAQHEAGFLVYSTLPTPAARDGTIRFADTDPAPSVGGDLPESYVLYPDNAFTEAEDSWAVANIDSAVVVRGDFNDMVNLYDHRAGFNNQVISSGVRPMGEAITALAALGSDIDARAGKWDPNTFALADTTFIAASTDRSRIAIGEGARSSTGRIFMCCEITPGPPLKIGISSGVAVTDLVNNASERVFGVGLNQNGEYGVARGALGTYYFTPDLRLQGEFRGSVEGGAGGASLHPDHTSPTETGDKALSFAATPNRSIKIIDATHFYERGEVTIRDNVVGPLRAVLPAAAENAGLSPTDPNYIVVKLIAVTAGDNVVIVNVRRKDIGT